MNQQELFDLGGKTVLVTGAAGSVGRYAVQFAKLGGARVIGTVSSAEKEASAVAAGAGCGAASGAGGCRAGSLRLNGTSLVSCSGRSTPSSSSRSRSNASARPTRSPPVLPSWPHRWPVTSPAKPFMSTVACTWPEGQWSVVARAEARRFTLRRRMVRNWKRRPCAIKIAARFPRTKESHKDEQYRRTRTQDCRRAVGRQ